MARSIFSPIRSEATASILVLTDATGDRLLIDMPNAAGAAFIAAAIRNELAAAKRGT